MLPFACPLQTLQLVDGVGELPLDRCFVAENSVLYDPELLSQDEVDERALRGLVGVVKISHTVMNGISLVNFDGFAPASQWEELAATAHVPPTDNGEGSQRKKASR